MNVTVIGAGPAGVMAALRAAELGAATTILTRDDFGGMAAHDGPIPVRTLAHAARLLEEARHLSRYGIAAGDPRLDYAKLLARVREVVGDVASRSTQRDEARRLGVTIHERIGPVRFLDEHTVEAANGLRVAANRCIVCTGGRSRRLAVPGAELTAIHSDAWGLSEPPPSLIVIGGGMTGLQVASIFHAFGSRTQVFQRGPRILPDEDRDVSLEVARALRALGIEVHEEFGDVESFEKTSGGVRMIYSKDGRRGAAEASLVVTAIGWTADTSGMNLAGAGVSLDERKFIRVDRFLATSNPCIYAAGDVTGRTVLVPPAVLDAYAAATNAVTGNSVASEAHAIPMGGFTDPEYAHVGLTEDAARELHDVSVGLIRFDETARTIIDGKTMGFCKVIADRGTREIVGCHVVGERAADIVQAATIAMAGGLTVTELAKLPLAFPTYVGILSRAAYRAAPRSSKR